MKFKKMIFSIIKKQRIDLSIFSLVFISIGALLLSTIIYIDTAIQDKGESLKNQASKAQDIYGRNMKSFDLFDIATLMRNQYHILKNANPDHKALKIIEKDMLLKFCLSIKSMKHDLQGEYGKGPDEEELLKYNFFPDAFDAYIEMAKYYQDKGNEYQQVFLDKIKQTEDSIQRLNRLKKFILILSIIFTLFGQLSEIIIRRYDKK